MHNMEQASFTPIRTAVIGFGVSARVFHLPFIEKSPLFEIVAFVERSGSKSREHYPQAQIFSDVPSLLVDPPELVIVCSPNDAHFDQAKLCIEAGCHVLVEKPITVTTEQAATLIDLAEKKRVILTVFHSRRLDGDFLTVKDILAKGQLGRLVEAELRYDRWRPGLRPKVWKENGSQGSSLLEDLGSHLIDQAVQLWGMPAQITARLSRQREGSQVEDAFDLRLDYADTATNSGLSVRLKGGMLVKAALPYFCLLGTGGSFVKYGSDPQEAQLMGGLSPDDPAFGVEDEQFHGLLQCQINPGDAQSEWIHTALPTIKGNYAAFHVNLAHAIRNGEALLVHANEALTVMRIIAAAHTSSAEGRSITL